MLGKKKESGLFKMPKYVEYTRNHFTFKAEERFFFAFVNN